MKLARVSAAMFGLGFTIVPSVLFFAGEMTQDTAKTIMLVGTILWFIVVIPQWKRG
jgi:uncharacterized membrane protein YfcA